MSSRPVRIAVEGCGHGTLHAIYASITESCMTKASEETPSSKGWENGPDLVIIGGDFQAVRNADDLTAMSVPTKYREIGDFHEYYSGMRQAPYLTIFIGGNHEASNHMFELYYGGWVAPNIYYMGAANVLRFGPLRIAGMSGIWKGYNYRKPHYERLPYSADDVKSIYHVREFDVRKLLQIKSQVDIGLSHDWPNGIEWLGDWKQLFRFKPHFEEDARSGRLGNIAARHVLDRLRPRYWFSAHLHCKFSAIVNHDEHQSNEHQASDRQVTTNEDEIAIDLNDDEEEEEEEGITNRQAGSTEGSGVPEDLRAQLPDTFSKPQSRGFQSNSSYSILDHGVSDQITNKATMFLALDKCLPGRRFLQLLEMPSEDASTPAGLPSTPFELSYDPEWLAITRAFASFFQVGDPDVRVPTERDYTTELDAARTWVDINVVGKDVLQIPKNFEKTAPFYDAARGISTVQRPDEYPNPQTTAFCSMLGIDNPFDISAEARQQRKMDFFASGGDRVDPRINPRGGHRNRGRGGRGNFRGRRGGRGFQRG